MENRAFTSWTTAASGLAPGRCRGFTLVEVLVALVIFAIGFAMVAGVIPAGHLLNRQAEDDVLAAIAGRNAAAAVEARKIYAPAFEHAMMHGSVAGGAYNGGNAATSDAQAAANGGQVWGLEAAFRNGAAIADFENALMPASAPAFTWPSSWPNYAGSCPGWANASTGFRFFADTDSDGSGAGWNGTIPHPDAAGDATNLSLGRIHAYHRRAGWQDALPPEDLSYPGYTPTVADRAYICIPLALDANANPSNRRWTGLIAVLRRRGGDTWPERSLGHDGGLILNARSIQATLPSHPNPGTFFATYAVGTAADPSTPNPDLPGLYCVPMFVYDYNANLIEAQYPDCWTPGTAYTPSVDRRLKAGDMFIAREGGNVFTIVSTRDDPGNPDPHCQILEVYPPLRSTLLGSNAAPAWRLRAGYFAPPPSSGGASPMIRVENVSAVRGFTANPNH